jgi:XapX domain-containing protein|tara:strand:- start:9212 stop:9460 length:249 start_codon:yes stop_codon:yes gene_type:complete
VKIYLIALIVGMLAGLLYGLVGVRSPAPPLIALIGLAGILLGEQLVPLAKRVGDRAELARFVHNDAIPALLGVPAHPDSNRP